MKRVLIVGATAEAWKPEQRGVVAREIQAALIKQMSLTYGHYESVRNPRSVTLLVSEEPLSGVEAWAEVIADLEGTFKKVVSSEGAAGLSEVLLRKVEQCDVLLCFQPEQRKRGLGTWALDQAENLGKECHLVSIPLAEEAPLVA